MKWCLPLASLPEGKGPAVDITGATTGVSVAEETIDADVTVDNNVTAGDSELSKSSSKSAEFPNPSPR